MTLEKVVVSADILANREVIIHGENGFLAKEVTDYLNYISKVFENEEMRNDMGKKASETIKARFSRQNCLNDTLDLYNKTINATNRN
jgi:glycosyltransferase involved in cell wall biosynthesis